MRVLFIGAGAGLVFGAMLGGGPFGLLGMIIGASLGALAGGTLLPLLTHASASEYARHPHLVSCPESGQTVPVTVAPESLHDAFFKKGSHPHVTDCPRWSERGKCSSPCEKDLAS